MANAFDAIDFLSFSNRNYDLWYTNRIVRVICVQKVIRGVKNNRRTDSRNNKIILILIDRNVSIDKVLKFTKKIFIETVTNFIYYNF